MPVPGDLPTGVLGYGVLFGLVHLLLFSYVYRATAATDAAAQSRSAARSNAGEVDPAEGIVHCSNCGTENELGYRFCRQCVEEFPGRVARAGSAASPTSRGIL